MWIKGACPYQPPPNQGYEKDIKHHRHTTQPNIALNYTSQAGQTTNQKYKNFISPEKSLQYVSDAMSKIIPSSLYKMNFLSF